MSARPDGTAEHPAAPANPADDGSSLDRPLRGIRVVDLMTGPLGAIGRHLREWGADVLRVEPPAGAAERRSGRTVAGVSLEFVAANLGKRATVLDLHEPAGMAAFDALLRNADVLLENTVPGSDGAALLDVDALASRYPGLVILSATPFGRTGSYRKWQATGPVLHALSGELSRSGIPGLPPLLPPGDLAYACAIPQAVFVVLVACLEQLRTGIGDHLDFAVLDGAVNALDPGYGIGGSATAGVPASELPRGRPEARHLYPIIPCADGFVRICVLAPRQWRGLFTWMGSPEEFADPSFDQLRTRFASTTLIPAISEFFSDQRRADLEMAGQKCGVPIAALLDVDEALMTEQSLARSAFVPVNISSDVVAPFPDGVVEIDGQRAGIHGGPPELTEAGGFVARATRFANNELGTAQLRPLAGLRVLDLGVIVVGAEQGRLLADQGADVIKIENDSFPDGSRQTPDGSIMSVTFAAGHRNKRSLGLDLRSAEGKDLFLRLVADTDVILSNFRPGTLQSLGFDYETLRQANPGVVVVDSSAFGSSGPWSDRLGYGPLVRACSGLTAQWRYPDDPQGFSDAITVYPDHVAARIGVAAALALLIRRQRTGYGGTVSVSQSEVMLSHMATTIAEKSLLNHGHDVQGDVVRDAPWGVFPTAGDDNWCVVTVRSNDDWVALCTVLDRLDLAEDPALSDASGRDNARHQIDAVVSEWLADQDAESVVTLLQAAGVPAATMLRVSELPEHPYFIERNFFRVTEHPAIRQSFLLENAPVRSSRWPDPPDRPAPLLGQHSDQIMAERLGLTAAEIASLVEQHVLQPEKTPSLHRS